MLPMKLKVNELTRAEREGRTQRGKPLVVEGAIENGAASGNEAGSANEEDSSEEDGHSHTLPPSPKNEICIISCLARQGILSILKGLQQWHPLVRL
jgi:hypothetical protein